LERLGDGTYFIAIPVCTETSLYGITVLVVSKHGMRLLPQRIIRIQNLVQDTKITNTL
jgi:hypothetical protein